MANNRIFWACTAAGVAPLGSNSFTEIHGLQSIGLTTTFNLEQIFEIGQLEIYENVENIPDIEVTMEKVLDGYPLIYHLATRGYPSNTLSGRQNQRCSVALSIYGDTQDSASGVPQTSVIMSGMFFSSLSFNFPSDGNFTESVTLVGNNKQWDLSAPFSFTPTFDNTDSPKAISGSGGVNRREDLIWDSVAQPLTRDANGAVEATDATILPNEIDGISTSGTNNRINDVRGAHVSNISISVDLGRENVNELGRRGPYYRFINFPTEVSCDIEIITTQGDKIDALEENENNITDQSIRIYTREGTFINLGIKNKLSSVTYGGADTGGGQATVTYSYTTFNTLVVQHPEDPVSV